MRAYPNLHPLVARHLGIRMMYAPPLRPAHSMVTPIRPLVVRCTHNFAGAMLYCSNLRMRLRRRFIMDIAQGLSAFPFVFLLALPVSQLIDDPRWYLISIIPQACRRRPDKLRVLPPSLHKLRQLVDEEVPTCLTSPLSGSVSV